MNPREPQSVPLETQKESVVLSLVAAHAALIHELESKSELNLTRGSILATFRGGAILNQNQVAKVLRIDRTVVHRSVRSLVEEGYLEETPAEKGRSLLLTLTAKGERFRETMISHRKQLDQRLVARLGEAGAERLRSALQAVADEVQRS